MSTDHVTSARIAALASIGARYPELLSAQQVREVCASALSQARDQPSIEPTQPDMTSPVNALAHYAQGNALSDLVTSDRDPRATSASRNRLADCLMPPEIFGPTIHPVATRG
jgi:hypothetical protein